MLSGTPFRNSSHRPKPRFVVVQQQRGRSDRRSKPSAWKDIYGTSAGPGHQRYIPADDGRAPRERAVTCWSHCRQIEETSFFSEPSDASQQKRDETRSSIVPIGWFCSASCHLLVRREGFRRPAGVCEAESALRQNHLVCGQDNRIGACPPFNLSLPTPIHSPMDFEVLAGSSGSLHARSNTFAPHHGIPRKNYPGSS
jgi:hypothetical protein